MATLAAGRNRHMAKTADGSRTSGADLSKLPAHELYESLPLQKRRLTVDLVGWLVGDRKTGPAGDQVVEALCQQLIAAGVPLDRYASSATVLMADRDALGRLWLRGQGVKQTSYVRPGAEDPDYLASPFFEADRTGRWVELWLPDTPNDRFGIVEELKCDGYVHYLCMPLMLSNGTVGWTSMASKAKRGFSTEDLTVIALVIPAITSLIDVRVTWANLDQLLRTYVGDEPHRAILAGNVKRGQVSTIRSAILFADMRDSTGHTAELGAVEAVNLFNDFFDSLVPPIESRLGEVLKYMGDGLLAIFRESSDDGCDAAARALEAGEAALDNIKIFNQGRQGQRPVELGIALHYGEAAYGNVGSGLRLDFTVIGRDVSLASRIGGMNARLGEPLLMSEAFIARLRRAAVPLGAFAARGFTSPVAVFRPGEKVAAQ